MKYKFPILGFIVAFLLSPALMAQTIPPVILTWQDNSSGSGEELQFNIERKLNTGTYGKIGQVGTGVTTYTDSTRIQSVGVANTYCYRVNAQNSAGVSAYTQEIACAPVLAALPVPSTIPTAPSGLTAK